MSGPLTITISEVGTSQSVTIVDNNTTGGQGVGVDTGSGIGVINYTATGSSSPFTDFDINAINATSNRVTATSTALMTGGGTVTRTTSTAGAHTLKIVVTDTGFLNPTDPQNLTSRSSGTFTNPSSSDLMQFISTAAGVSAPTITLTPNLANNPDSENASLDPVSIPDVSPYDVSETYYITLGPNSNSSSGQTSVNFLATGLTAVTGTNTPAQLSGTVFYDANHDLFPLPNSPGDAGLQGVTVTLVGKDIAGNPVSLSTTTDQNGFYSFPNLAQSDATGYTVTEGATPGYIHEGQFPGSTGGTSGTRIITTVLPKSGNSINNNFAEILTSSISGYKFNDLNGDGVWEANGIDPVTDVYSNPITTDPESALGGVTLALYTDTNGTLSKNSLQTTVTSSAAGSLGYYSFTNLATLPAGTTYAVREVVPTGWVQTTANPADISGAAGTNASNVNFGDVMADCGCGYTIVCETVTGPCGPTQISGLRGHTDQGEVLSVTFTVPKGKTADLSLVSYTAPASSFDANTASQQVVFDEDSPGVVGPGTYTLTVQIPNSYYQVDLVCGGVIDKLGPANSNVFYTPQGRLIDADNDGTERQLTNPASLSGEVYVDTNDNGQDDSNEAGLAGVTIHLTGTDIYNNKVNLTRITGADGSYSFNGLQPGTYSVTEVQPSGFVTTANSIGTDNSVTDGHLASPTTNTIDSVLLNYSSGGKSYGSTGINYNFGEIDSGSSVCRGATQTTSFWHGSTGQALIKCFDGGSSSTALGNWLATSFPNLYGSGHTNLTGDTNAQVAAYYQSLYNSSSSSAEVQILATALNVYASSSALGGCSAASSCGFTVTDGGLGCETTSTGSCSSLFGTSNASVIQLLQCANSQYTNGVYSGSSSNHSKVASLFSGICSY